MELNKCCAKRSTPETKEELEARFRKHTEMCRFLENARKVRSKIQEKYSNEVWYSGIGLTPQLNVLIRVNDKFKDIIIPDEVDGIKIEVVKIGEINPSDGDEE